jgi:hypothetical protein
LPAQLTALWVIIVFLWRETEPDSTWLLCEMFPCGAYSLYNKEKRSSGTQGRL